MIGKSVTFPGVVEIRKCHRFTGRDVTDMPIPPAHTHASLTGDGPSSRDRANLLAFRIMPKKPLKTRVLRKFGPRVAVSSNQFRDARIFSGMTREQAADFLQVSVRTIGHWETHKKPENWSLSPNKLVAAAVYCSARRRLNWPTPPSDLDRLAGTSVWR